MKTKTITYKRIYNLGNYEAKHLEECDEVFEGEDIEEAISRLMERVERKIREVAHREIEAEGRQLKKELSELKEQISEAKAELSTLSQKAEEPNLDNIPFDPGTSATNSDVPDGF
ncbi:hypothetical protein [Nostoc sp.]|uniref:hypothetical protein n=1 Tax=Nostoc sp. TaxID=1180 RepID=UPI002FFAC955